MQLAMIKNQRLAEQLVGGDIYDCVCRFEAGSVEVANEDLEG